MEIEKMKPLKPEDSVKFFVGLASAGIGLMAVFVEKHPFPKGSSNAVLFFVFGLISLVCFALCFFLGISFYHDAMDLGRGVLDHDKELQHEERARKDAKRCGDFCLVGAVALAFNTLLVFFAR
jgi:hypothetical protein